MEIFYSGKKSGKMSLPSEKFSNYAPGSCGEWNLNSVMLNALQFMTVELA